MSAPGPPKRRAKQCPELDLYKDEIILRFSVDRWSVKKIARSFNEDYGLNATEKQYSGRLQSWGCRKYIKRDEWQQIDHDVLLREQAGKESQVVLNRLGLLSEKAIKKGRRHHVTFTNRIFSKNDSAPKTLEPPQVEVTTPPNWETSLPLIYTPKTILSILPRLPIKTVEERLVNLVLHRFHLQKNDTQISTVKMQPFFILLRTIIFRLSNNIFRDREIHTLLDRVDEQGYRAPLKQLLSLKEVSIQAACSNLLKHLYVRGDRELVTHIHRCHPEIYPQIYSYLKSASQVYSDQLSSTMLQSFKLHSPFYSPPSNFGYLDSCYFISKEIASRGLSPNSAEDAKNLLFVCKAILQDLGLFLELWDPSVISIFKIEISLGFHGIVLQHLIPLFCENYLHFKQLYSIGFWGGAVLVSLKSALGNHSQLSQLCLRYLYTYEESKISKLGENEFASDHAHVTPLQLNRMIVDLSFELDEMGVDTTMHIDCECNRTDFLLLYLTSGLPHVFNDLMKVWNLRYTTETLPIAISNVLVCCIRHGEFCGPYIYQVLTNYDTSISPIQLHDLFYETGIIQQAGFFTTLWEETLRQRFIEYDKMYLDEEVLDYLLSRGVNIYQPIQIFASDAKALKEHKQFTSDYETKKRTGNLKTLDEPSMKTPLLIALLQTTPALFHYLRSRATDVLQNFGYNANTLLSPEFRQAVLRQDEALISSLWEKRFNIIPEATDRIREKIVAMDLEGAIEECRSICLGNTYLECGLVYYWVNAVANPYKGEMYASFRGMWSQRQYSRTKLVPFAKTVLGECELLSEKFDSNPAAHINAFRKVTGADSLGSIFCQTIKATISNRKLDLQELLLLHGPGKSFLHHYFNQNCFFVVDAIGVAVAAKETIQHLELFIKAGISISMVYAVGLRPLHDAVGKSNLNMILYLLSKGADIYASNGKGYRFTGTAVEAVVASGQIDVMAILLEHRPDCYQHALDAAVRLERPFLAQFIRGWKDSDHNINGGVDRRLADALIKSL